MPGRHPSTLTDERPLSERARDALRVDGPPWARLVADVAGCVAVVSVPAGAWHGPVGVSLFALVLLGVVLARLAPLPGPVQALTVTVLVAAAWAALLNGYEQVAWLDIAAHLVATGLLAAVAVTLLRRSGWIGWGHRSRPGRARAGTVLVTTSLGVALAVLWEFGEWVGHTHLDPGIAVGYDDTIGDLAAGMLGALIAGFAYARTAPKEAGQP